MAISGDKVFMVYRPANLNINNVTLSNYNNPIGDNKIKYSYQGSYINIAIGDVYIDVSKYAQFTDANLKKIKLYDRGSNHMIVDRDSSDIDVTVITNPLEIPTMKAGTVIATLSADALGYDLEQNYRVLDLVLEFNLDDGKAHIGELPKYIQVFRVKLGAMTLDPSVPIN